MADSAQIHDWKCPECGSVIDIRIEESPNEPESYEYSDIQDNGTVTGMHGQTVRELQITLFCPCTYKVLRGQFEVKDNG